MNQNVRNNGGLRSPPGGRPAGPALKPLDLALEQVAQQLARALGREVGRHGGAPQSPAVADLRRQVAAVLVQLAACRASIEAIGVEARRAADAAAEQAKCDPADTLNTDLGTDMPNSVHKALDTEPRKP